MSGEHRLSTSSAGLVAHGIRVELSDGAPIVDDVSLSVQQGQVLGLVGESGSGKTTIGLALLGSVRSGATITRGELQVGGEHVDLTDPSSRGRLRGRLVSYVPQDPANSLNPSLRVGRSIQDVYDAHHSERSPGVVARMLRSVGLPDGQTFARRYPHQLSGGQQQRVTIAMALASATPVVVLDEPTTALDVVTQAQVLTEIDRLRREQDLAMIYVSHDLAVIAGIADRIAVMYAGRIVEEGPTEDLLTRPAHPYTRGLLESVPDLRRPRSLRSMSGVAVGVGERPAGCAFAPRCPQRTPRCDEEAPPLEVIATLRGVRCFEWRRTLPIEVAPPVWPTAIDVADTLLSVEHLVATHGRGRDLVVAVGDVSFELRRGESVALVGESGSGKTTVARCISGLHTPAAGRILLGGRSLPGPAKRRTREDRRQIQVVFQNPHDSLNPKHRIGDAIARPARTLRGLSAETAAAEVGRLLERVRLPARLASRYPGELSGGERQRVAIARALAASPDVLICDEITSSLDVSVQAAVLDLLAELRAGSDLTLLLITHDLGVVANVADRMVVLEKGVVRESGPTADVIQHPSDAYSRTLINAAPSLPGTV